jgi:hypothetical protein
MAGAVSELTIRPRNPSGTNRITLWGRFVCENPTLVDSKINPADRITARRIL